MLGKPTPPPQAIPSILRLAGAHDPNRHKPRQPTEAPATPTSAAPGAEQHR